MGLGEVSDSYVLSWDTFPPTTLPPPALIGEDMPCLIATYTPYFVAIPLRSALSEGKWRRRIGFGGGLMGEKHI